MSKNELWVEKIYSLFKTPDADAQIANVSISEIFLLIPLSCEIENIG